MPYVNTRKAVALLGVHPNTLRKWANDGRIEHIRSPGGRRLYDVDAFLRESVGVEVVLYARVSSSAPKDDLHGQVALPAIPLSRSRDHQRHRRRPQLEAERTCRPTGTPARRRKVAKLWLPTKTVLHGSALNLLNGWQSKTGARSWFSTSQSVAQNKNSRRIFYPFWIRSLAGCTACASIVTKSRKIRIYPTSRAEGDG